MAKNNKKNIIIILLFCSIQTTSAQVIFQRIFKGGGITQVWFGEQTSDAGFIVVGGPSVVKTDANGYLVWSKLYWGPDIKCIHQTSDGGFVMVGDMYQGIPDYDDGVILKTDSIGNILWAKTFGGVNFQLFHDFEQTRDGGYIISGRSADSATNYRLTLIKYDELGNQLWSKCFRDIANPKIRQTEDGSYIVAGTTRGCGQHSGTLVKIDTLGNLLWTKDYCDTYIDDFNFRDIQLTTDGGYIISGRVRIPQTVFFADLFLMKTDSVGSIIWQKAYAGTHYGSSDFWGVKPTPDGGYVAAGYSGDYGATYSDAILVKTDSTGNIIWSKVYGRTTGSHAALSIGLTTDGGYILSGQIVPPGGNANDKYFYLIKTDSVGNSGCLEANVFPAQWQTTMQEVAAASVDTIGLSSFPVTINVTTPGTEYDFCYFVSLPEYLPHNNIFSLYPNPTISSFDISFKQDLFNATIKIFNVFGEQVYSENFSGTRKTIDYELNTGIYFVEVMNGNERWIQKFIKQ